jgi:hypothetical protein
MFIRVSSHYLRKNDTPDKFDVDKKGRICAAMISKLNLFSENMQF